MKTLLRHNYIDFANAIGAKRYIVSDGQNIDLIHLLKSNPLINGILNVGPYFLLLGDVKTWQTLYVSEGCEKISGYTVDEAIAMGPQLMVAFTHPEDYPVAMETNRQAVVMLYESNPVDRPFLSCVFYHRGVHKSGQVMNIMQHIVPVAFDLQGNPYIFAIVITDITHLQIPRLPKTVLIDHKRNEYKLINPGAPFFNGERFHLSKRETEVLHLLADGFTTKEIAERLGVSFHTVATYRKRLLQKASVKNTTELVNFALVHALL